MCQPPQGWGIPGTICLVLRGSLFPGNSLLQAGEGCILGRFVASVSRHPLGGQHPLHGWLLSRLCLTLHQPKTHPANPKMLSRSGGQVHPLPAGIKLQQPGMWV